MEMFLIFLNLNNLKMVKTSINLNSIDFPFKTNLETQKLKKQLCSYLLSLFFSS